MDHGCTEESEEGSGRAEATQGCQEGGCSGGTGGGGSEASQASEEVGDFA
ncbi:MAG TPA: hypothetical protein VMS65_07540 [Polyangiaceae bacterium]|nr:hypothetical protein [Polyangiaceae bacterium]